ncbi:MAG TPA: SDR family NAD(P)-dependent oxidoreductase [archaeon]|nr:SDR family NAD(P)-dependent oxidoreductase [archaeon]
MTVKTIVITGASDGIGAAAARKLTASGHQVVVVGRSPLKTKAVANEIKAPFHIADFADLSEVRGLANSLIAEYPRINVLANNAGGIFGTRDKTVDGFEKTFQVNHLAPFLLTDLLHEKLISSSATVISTASLAGRMWGKINLLDLNNDTDFTPRKAYGDAKLANILFTRELQRRFGNQGISAVAFHPGTVATNFASDSTSWIRLAYHNPFIRLPGLSTPEQGARQLVWLAESQPKVDWQPGEYYEKGKISKTHKQAADPVLAREFWDISAAMLGIQ